MIWEQEMEGIRMEVGKGNVGGGGRVWGKEQQGSGRPLSS